MGQVRITPRDLGLKALLVCQPYVLLADHAIERFLPKRVL